MAKEYGVLVWVSEDKVDEFVSKLKSDPAVSEFEIIEETEV